MDAKPPILVVEDETAIRVGLCDVLAYHGFAPTGVDNGDDGLAEALSGRYRLLVLDVMLPGVDGFTIARTVRDKLPKQAILMLTAKGAESDVLEGFNSGADDYVSKPFSVPQLVARVQALVRRAAPESRRQFQLGSLDVNADTLVASKGGALEELSPRDIEVLAYFSASPGKVISREDLLRDVWGYARAEALETRCVDMHIAKLRKKLVPLGAGGDSLIETVRGAGYRVRV
ncbi:MAG: response regulator transcription factor [Deltaproteobacteria bacterium]|nr:response regulator transcription factor [Deltaproteobacteria bacterium]